MSPKRGTEASYCVSEGLIGGSERLGDLPRVAEQQKQSQIRTQVSSLWDPSTNHPARLGQVGGRALKKVLSGTDLSICCSHWTGGLRGQGARHVSGLSSAPPVLSREPTGCLERGEEHFPSMHGAPQATGHPHLEAAPLCSASPAPLGAE